VLCEDPDAPLHKPYVHWLVYGIEPDTHVLHEGLPPTGAPLSDGAQQGRNTAGDHGYTGPQPPPGHGRHHYHFQVFALDEPLDLHAPVTRNRLVATMRGHVLAWGEIIGTSER
jgi:Raf kinase inhibitor-like YbhB/YbcL family protein